MGNALFYHLTRGPLERTLPLLLGKALEAGWRVEVRGTDAGRMAWLDEALWTGAEAGFLPHGLAGGRHDADQPILLTTGGGAGNRPACLMAVDGAEVAPDELAGLERACILFDGLDGAAVQAARAQWTTLTGAGCAAQYWSEETGRWQMKAESGAPA